MNHSHMIETDIKEFDISNGYGFCIDKKDIKINGYLFSRNDPYDDAGGGIRLSREDKINLIEYKTLTDNYSSLKVYLNLIVIHELAHIGEAGTIVRLTGHGVTDRIETKILSILYASKKISKETFSQIFSFLENYRNISNEPKEKIRDYKKAVLNM